MKELINDIINKKELKNIPEVFIRKIIEEEIENNTELFDLLKKKEFNKKSKEYKSFKKNIRKKLRIVYGVFQSTSLTNIKRKKILETLTSTKKNKDSIKEEEIIKNILSSHLSTNERLKHFYEVYSKIIELSIQPKSVADLACGFNPFSYTYWNSKVKYFASDISKEDMNFIKDFFLIENISGEFLSGDLTEEAFVNLIVEKIKKYDICLLFKTMDSLENLKKGSSSTLLKKIQNKTIVISFPIGSISGKSKITSKRKWFQKALKLKNSDGWDIFDFLIDNEKYYLLHKT